MFARSRFSSSRWGKKQRLFEKTVDSARRRSGNKLPGNFNFMESMFDDPKVIDSAHSFSRWKANFGQLHFYGMRDRPGIQKPKILHTWQRGRFEQLEIWDPTFTIGKTIRSRARAVGTCRIHDETQKRIDTVETNFGEFQFCGMFDDTNLSILRVYRIKKRASKKFQIQVSRF